MDADWVHVQHDRGIGFEKIVFHVERGDLLDILEHPNPRSQACCTSTRRDGSRKFKREPSPPVHQQHDRRRARFNVHDARRRPKKHEDGWFGEPRAVIMPRVDQTLTRLFVEIPRIS